MEKKYPPRVRIWIDPKTNSPAHERYEDQHEQMGHVDHSYISKEEHDAIVQPLVEALKRYETAAFDVNGQMFSVGSVAKQALENYKKQTGVKDE